jgi:uncharacterized protein
VVAPNHPIVRGFPHPWTTIDEELYEIDRTRPGMTPLAEAYSIESEKRHPLIWPNTYGKARVFVTSMGHNNEMMANPVFLDVVTRGCSGRSTCSRRTASGGRIRPALTSSPLRA